MKNLIKNLPILAFVFTSNPLHRVVCPCISSFRKLPKDNQKP